MIVSSLLFVPALDLFSAESGEFWLRDGKLYRCRGGKEVLPVTGIVAFHNEKGSIFYIRREGPGKTLVAGFAPSTSSDPMEKRLPLDGKDYRVLSLYGWGHLLYFLAHRKGEDIPFLYRVNMNERTIRGLRRVIDFRLSGPRPVMIRPGEKGRGYVLVLGRRQVPLQGEADPRIEDIRENMFCVVRSGDTRELVDLANMISLARYAPGVTYALPEDHNLAVEVRSPPREEHYRPGRSELPVYYRVYVDGKESGRTDTGPASTTRSVQIMLKPGRYYRVRLEKWELNSSRERYVRSNNIDQPPAIRLYLPHNRIIEYEVIEEKNGYSHRTRARVAR